jgi:hypothetical protein
MDDSRPFVDDIVEAVKEGRVGAAVAAEWLELRIAEHVRQVHAARQQRRSLHALAWMSDAEADRLLPPRGSELIPAPWEMSNAEADELLPPRSREEAERRHRAWDVRAAAVEDLTAAELYRLLFGEGG